MAWTETDPMKERLHFVADWDRRLYTVTELCARYGVSRKTGYKWLARYADVGVAGLAERSRAPHRPRRRGGDRRGAAATPELGSPQAARMARRPPPGARAARSKYGGRSLAPPGTRAAAPPPPSLEASGRARTRYRGAERRVDRGLQGPLPHRRWRVLLSPDGRRPAQPLSARL